MTTLPVIREDAWTPASPAKAPTALIVSVAVTFWPNDAAPGILPRLRRILAQ